MYKHTNQEYFEKVYRIQDTIYDLGVLKINININVSEYLPATDNYPERQTYFWSEYKTSRQGFADILIKRKIDAYLTLNYKDYMKDFHNDLYVPVDLVPTLIELLEYSVQYLFGAGQTVFINENGILRVQRNLPVVVQDFPKNKFFKITPCIINTTERQFIGATLTIGDQNCVVDVTEAKLKGLLYVLRTLNIPTYASIALSTLGTPVDSSPFRRIMKDTEINRESTTTGVVGRVFSKKDSFFDKV